MSKGKRTYKKKKQTATKIDMMIAGLIILSILLAVLIYSKSGFIGKQLNEVLGGMLGIMEYILPIGTFILGIRIACDNKENISAKLVLFLVMLISFSVVFSVFQISFGELNTTKNISEIAKDAYQIGILAKGGGALGAIIAVPLVNLLGKVGAIILCIGVAVLLIIFTFGINTSEIISSNVDKIKEKRDEKKERRKQYKMELIQDDEIQKSQNRNRTKAKKIFDQINNNPKDDLMENQIKINFGGAALDIEKANEEKLSNIRNKTSKKSMRKEDMQPDVIEANLFSTVEKEKESNTKEVLQLEHTIAVEDENYESPPIEILSKGTKKALKGGTKALTNTASKLQKTLYSFGVSAKVENVSVGPAITRYELKPAQGVRVSKIANLADDIALNLAAETIRIEAPIPGKQAVGIEVPNKERQAVHLREVLESDKYRECDSKTAVALGKDVAGETEIADIAKMPHVLIAGSTGSGKSVCVNTIITSIIYKSKPNEVKFVMIDPKVVELSVYNGIPHLLIPVVTDPKKAAGALAWAVQEMENRYSLFAKNGVRDLKG